MTVAPVDARDIATWDVEADVVIAGYGIAGVSAAIEAARAGAEVVVLERTGGWGGAASLAGGFVYLGGGTPIQKACGFEDSVDNMRTFLCAAMGPGADVGPDHRLLRWQPRAFRLAGGLRCAVQAELLG